MTAYNFKLECLSCGAFYDYNNSTATESSRSIFCSDSCEGEETQRLTEGNSIIENAMKENPLAFAHSIRPELNAENFASSPEAKAITNMVDDVFSRLQIKKN